MQLKEIHVLIGAEANPKQVNNSEYKQNSTKNNIFLNTLENEGLGNIFFNRFTDLKIHKETNIFFWISFEEEFIEFIAVHDNKLIRENTVNWINIAVYETNISNFKVSECSDGIDLLNKVKNDKK